MLWAMLLAWGLVSARAEPIVQVSSVTSVVVTETVTPARKTTKSYRVEAERLVKELDVTSNPLILTEASVDFWEDALAWEDSLPDGSEETSEGDITND